MCSEFWIGWFDHEGEPHHVRDAADAAADLGRLLAVGASVNICMFHGGTSFGFTNGANHDHAYAPTITSYDYDYDAPLTESGDPGPKYYAFREVIARQASVSDEPAPAPSTRLPAAAVGLDRHAALLPHAGTLAEPVRTERPPTMEELGLRSGYVLYRTTLPVAGDGLLHFAGGVGDRAQVFVDGAPVGVLERERHDETLPVRVPRPGVTLVVLVENMGGVNYGSHIGDPEGLFGPVTLNSATLHGWDCHPLGPGRPEPAPLHARDRHRSGLPPRHLRRTHPCRHFPGPARLGQGPGLGQRLPPRPLLEPRPRSTPCTSPRPSCAPAATASSCWNCTPPPATTPASPRPPDLGR
jgi:beta-galactosidase